MKMLPMQRFWRPGILLSGLLFFLVALPELSAQRRFPHLFTLDSRSPDTLATPDPTSSRHRYRVTAWGTYSMWEDTINSSVDPIWIYSFPDEEWAKPEWRIFDGYPIYVGDPKMFDSHGLRVNNQPFPEQPLNSVDHKYSMIIQGDGNPLTTAIVDWNFRGLVKRDAHDNNSGFLYVLVEELPLTEIEICAIDSSQFPVVRVSMRVMQDSVQVDNFSDKLQLYENGLPVTIDSVDCSERIRPVSVAMVFDRSGSMDEVWGLSTRIEEVKTAGRKFVDRLTDADEAAIYSFSNWPTLDQTWTNNRTAMRQAIDRLQPEGYTAMNDAVDRALTDIANRPVSYKKAVVVLSDGEDNISSIEKIGDVIAHAKQIGVPVFAIGLLLDKDDSLQALARETGGAYFSVRDASAIDSVFNSIAERLFEKGCCNVWYRSPRPTKDGTWRLVETTLRLESETVSAPDDGYRAPTSTSGVNDRTDNGSLNVSIVPNPAAEGTTVIVTLPLSTTANVQVVNILGETLLTIPGVHLQPGSNQIDIPLTQFVAGRYFLVIEGEKLSWRGRLDVVR
ncbi:MAG: VWA domain-containing protein [Ignavibacteriae bacterium]|nr:VWA domain-containing protein [Ignavibacteriota bacterium]MCB9216323.1 VWA domain-containing protein [Ignavibacteria bacterium]